ncbi:SitI3 family protein [Archangium gephyra]|uniref:SitI3 family protein n=1 Tax=Archangium gephyra TaxID=48 RepID=UPI0035D4E921
MAIDYFLELATRLTTTRALELLSSRFPGLVWGEDRFFLFDASVTIHATEPGTLAKEIIADAFHFTPALTVGFRYPKDPEQYDGFRKILLDAALLLLEHAQDAVLLVNGESIVLQRLGGKLTFNSEHSMWDEDWLKSRLLIPFECRSLPSPQM